MALAHGASAFVGNQLAQWLYAKRATSFGEMTNISLKHRQFFEQHYALGRIAPADIRISRDGTKKYLYQVSERGHSVECAMIPSGDRVTLCLSTQVGCKMGCKFCATGAQGFHGHLPASEIVNQLLSVEESERVTHLVIMGMGEPLDNLENTLRALEIFCAPWGLAMSPRRITLSTVGLKAPLQAFLKGSECHLAVSLHSPFPEEREELMPATRAFPLPQLLELLSRYNWRGQRKLSFEYVLLKGVNDTPRHITALARLLRGWPCLLNVITYHAHPGAPFSPTNRSLAQTIVERLNALGLRATLRASRGEDIEAACGLLSQTAAKGY